MWQEILNIVISNGIFAVLFVLLLSYLLKDSARREKKYNDFIENISKNLTQALDLKKQTEDVKLSIEVTKDKVDENSHLIKKVQDEVKVVKKDVKEIKKIIKKPQTIEEGEHEKQI